LALTSPTGGGHSVSIDRLQTKAVEFFYAFKISNYIMLNGRMTGECQTEKDLKEVVMTIPALALMDT
jgi:hypothetical protein